MQYLLKNLVYDYSYFQIYGLVLGYFLFLYLGLAPAFLKACQFLASKGWLNIIIDKPISSQQQNYEIKHSLLSIFIFGFSALPVIYFIRNGQIVLLPDTFLNILSGLILLTLWNEVHFFVIHRLMHLPFFMKYVHLVHHKSHIPSVYSVYSFHGVEAMLLSTVPLTITPFVHIAPTAIMLYPLASILLNFAGHCNYRFGKGTGSRWKLIGTYHNEHHAKGRKNYGFASDFLDNLYSKMPENNRAPKDL